MEFGPSTSKKVTLLDRGAEEQLQKWYDEVLSDTSAAENECREEYHIESDHDTESEVEAEDDENSSDGQRNEAEVMYYYGKNRFKWSVKPATTNRGRRSKENIVIHLPGLRPSSKALGRKASPVDAWKLIFREEICNIILQWTNHKIAQERARYKNVDSATLKDLDITELFAFFGLLAYTAVFKSNNESINTLFATDGTGREIIRCIMSKERFAFLIVCLRFDNPEDRVMRRLDDRAAAIAEIFNLFVQTCQDCYTIGASACIDEMLVGFRGRCKFKMYIPNKPARYGLKIMCCTDARTGYFYNGYIYTGRDSDGGGLPNAEKSYSKPTQSVLRLAQPIYNTNRSVTFDNWFTSIELVTIMKERGLTCIGTIKKTKKEIPPDFLPKKNRGTGSVLYGFTKEITLVSYVPKKNKAVILVSSQHHHESEDPESGKPHIILDYNSTKGGVDMLDEKCSKFSCSRRSRRWPLTIFYRMFDISTVNAYVLHSSYPENPQIEGADFLKKLALELVTPHLQRRASNLSVNRKLRLTIFEILGQDKIGNISQTRVEKLEKRKNCSLCSYQKKRRTAYVCFDCQSPICLECAKKLCPECASTT